MKACRILALAALALLAVGCSSLQVYHDYDAAVDFAAIKTYGWMPVPKELEKFELTIKHIRSAVSRGLDARGLRATEQSSDVLIALHGGMEKRIAVEEWGYRHGNLTRDRLSAQHKIARYDDYVRRGTDVYEYTEGTLVVDLVDSRKKELIWRGMATWQSGRLMPTREDIDRIVTRILEGYPPLAAGAR